MLYHYFISGAKTLFSTYTCILVKQGNSIIHRKTKSEIARKQEEEREKTKKVKVNKQ